MITGKFLSIRQVLWCRDESVGQSHSANVCGDSWRQGGRHPQFSLFPFGVLVVLVVSLFVLSSAESKLFQVIRIFKLSRVGNYFATEKQKGLTNSRG